VTVYRHSFSNAGAMNAVFALTLARGFYAELDLDVELVEYPRTGDAVAATMLREVDSATGPGVNILTRAMAGQDPLNVLNLEGENIFALIGSRDITSPEDLRGTEVGTFAIPNQNYAVMNRALRILGLDPASDVTFVSEFADRAALLNAVDTGTISAICMTIPTTFMARAMGLPILLDFAPRNEPYQLGAVITSGRFADEDPDALVRFLAGTIRGVELFQSDFDAALPHLLDRSRLKNIDVLRQTHTVFTHALDHLRPTIPPLRAVAIDLEASLDTSIDIDIGALVQDSFYDLATRFPR